MSDIISPIDTGIEGVDNVREVVPFPWFFRQNISNIKWRVDDPLGIGLEIQKKKLKHILKDGFNIDVASLSDQEVQDISILFHFLLQRVVHAQIQFWGLQNEKKQQKIPRIGRSSIVWHDMAHCAARYILDPENSMKDPSRFTPTPLKYRYNWYAEHYDALVEELYATLWMGSGVWRWKNLYIFEMLREHPEITWESIYKIYIEKCLWGIREFKVGMNLLENLVDAFSLGYIELPFRTNRKNIVNHLRERIRNDHFEKLQILLADIYKDRDNPRVLFDLFYREMKPLIEQLKRRKVYRCLER